MTGAFLDRLTLDAARVEAMAGGIEAVRALKDPVGTVTEAWTRPNGMKIERVRCRSASSASSTKAGRT